MAPAGLQVQSTAAIKPLYPELNAVPHSVVCIPKAYSPCCMLYNCTAHLTWRAGFTVEVCKARMATASPPGLTQQHCRGNRVGLAHLIINFLRTRQVRAASSNGADDGVSRANCLRQAPVGHMSHFTRFAASCRVAQAGAPCSWARTGATPFFQCLQGRALAPQLWRVLA